MPREVQVLLLCDPCLNEDEEHTSGSPFVIAVGHLKPREIILCERHEKELLTPLRDMLPDLPTVDAITGPAAKPAFDNRGSIDCQLCNPVRTLKNPSTLAGHVRNQHKMLWSEYKKQFLADTEIAPQPRAVRPSDEQLFDNDPEYVIPEEFRCGVGDCETVYDPRKYNRPAQALGVHRYQKHGIKGPKNPKA